MRYDDVDESDFRDQVGLGSGKKRKGSFSEKLKWFFTVDFHDWTNYLAILFIILLAWIAFYNIMQILTVG